MAVLGAAAILLPNANASSDRTPSPRSMTLQQAARLGSTLATDLGEDAAGWYFDGSEDRLVVNVLDKQAAQEVRERGGVARIVENSTAELKSVTRTLSTKASVPGTAWSIDPRTNKVAVVADSTVTGAKMARLNRATDPLSGMVSVRKVAGAFKPFAAGDAAGVDGGDAIFGGGVRCSLGFNVTVDGAPGFLTAGHCGNAAKTWTADQAGNTALGSVVDSKFPVSDFSLVKYDDAKTAASSTVDLKDGNTQEITEAAEASVGMKVQRSGSTTGLRDGTVTGLNATVNYGNGDIVNGLIQTDVCAEPGDSGGSMFSGKSAVGLTSGGSGDCKQGGVTFFQPVTTALQALGAEIGNGNGGGADAGGADDGGADAGGADDGGADAGGADDGGAAAGGAAGGADDGGAAAGGADVGGAAAGGADDGGADAGGAAVGGADAGGAAVGGADAGGADDGGADAGGADYGGADAAGAAASGGSADHNGAGQG
uniref:S1 family peptidase n=1 Tax=Wenjunlia tyrosinilytica TaxID=1544741 RepID=UPI001E50E39E|nr:S1 family peptidase [Wenjunlia tyrosinilytica]